MTSYMGVGGENLHDSGVSVIDDKGNILYASMYERYSGRKHDPCPSSSWLREVWERYDKPLILNNDNWELRFKFRVMLEDYAIRKFPKTFDGELQKSKEWYDLHPIHRKDMRTSDHHVAHAAAAFATRPKSFAKEDCVMVVIDGVGEFRSSAIFNNNFEVMAETNFPKSLGYLYANFTDKQPGLRSNDDEYVVMGLSCYGEPTHWEKAHEMYRCIPSWTLEDQDGFEDLLWTEKYRMKTLYLDKINNFLMTSCKNQEDAAASLQRMTEEVIYEAMVEARKYGSKLCYSGGVAQNIMANNRIRELFDDVWIDVNPGDGGASLGAAAYFYMMDTGADRINWEHPYLGHVIDGELNPEMVVDHLMAKNVCGVANGAAEFSYRAYGNRSLIADVRYDVKDTVNIIKQRQLYRPFAPAILEEHVDDYFDGYTNRWMQFSAMAKHPYSSVTHVDGTGRVQLVHKDSKSVLRKILECYYDKTGIPMLLNTSLNIRGRPMVNSAYHAVMFEDKYNVKVFTS